MGLAAPRKRRKLAEDPNNTHWASSTTNYGHRMLIAQGWTPGNHLGARDAPHAKLHSAASFSHVRVALKENTLGVGAKPVGGVVPGTQAGLDSLQSIFGRLNGKSDQELQREQTAREDVRRGAYMEQRWGTMRFVSGGLLVGTRVEDDENKDEKTIEGCGSEDEARPEAEEAAMDEEVIEPVRSKRGKKKRKKCDVEEQVDVDEAVEDSPLPPPEENVKLKKKKKKNGEKKEKKERKSKKERYRLKHSLKS
ncbi:MAG: hypothetical protein M1823_002317 [Watsoniomyces obsoletus]|nr:MAG: hypothetical protein M1823_002317 [Watsoniomyces obsoletus]